VPTDRIAVVNPRTGDVIERVPVGDPRGAVDRAVRARDGWARTPASQEHAQQARRELEAGTVKIKVVHYRAASGSATGAGR
jgi:acyl-CoA reductase-like NAD-dependent aldehyde dehydrogenase